jgi:sugar lactone lactonase YvrE
MKLEVLADGFGFTEGTRWHNGKLWFSDFIQRRVRTVDLSGKVEDVVFVPGQPSGLGFMPDGSLRIVSMLDRHLMKIEDGFIRSIADLSRHAVGLTNDMVMDSRGNAWIGSMGYDFYRERQQPGTRSPILRVTPEGDVAIAAPGLRGPNGMVLINDEQTLVVAETHACRLTAFDIGRDGMLENRRLFADLDGIPPDGICANADGDIWVAGLYTEKFLLVRQGGQVRATLPTPGRWAIAAALGGQGGTTLFCATVTVAQNSDSRTGRSRAAIETIALD